MKRIVLEHTCGPYKGLLRIIGTTEEQPAFLAGPFQVTEAEEPIEFASLVKVTPRYLLFREITDPGNVKGRLDDYFPTSSPSFHPDQV